MGKCCGICVQKHVNNFFYCKKKKDSISNNIGLHGGLNLQDVARLACLHDFAYGMPVVKLCNTFHN